MYEGKVVLTGYDLQEPGCYRKQDITYKKQDITYRKQDTGQFKHT